MAAEGGNNAGVVAVLVIFLVVVVGGFFAWQNGMFGGKEATKVNIEVKAPEKAADPAPPKN